MKLLKYQNENFGGSCDFRCRWHDRFFVEAHLHEYSEILYVKEGFGDISVNGQPYRIPEGHLIFIPPNYLHEYTCQSCQVICAVFSNDLIPLFFREISGKRLIPEPVDMTGLTQILDTFHLLDPGDPVLLSGCLNLVCGKVLKSALFDSYQPSNSLLYQQVITWLSCHYTENISLKTIADKFGYNEKYLSHSLHSLTGMHFRHLLAHYRVERAKVLLCEKEDMPISQVALQCGFSALNTFNRVFKATTGLTPSQYRRN